MDTSERNLEERIEQALLAPRIPARVGKDSVVNETETPYHAHKAISGWEGVVAGGYSKRTSNDYDKQFCLIPDDVLTFIYATQPREWGLYKEQFPGGVEQAKTSFLRRLTQEIRNNGTLHVLRQGMKDRGHHFRLAYFKPANSLNPETEKLYQSNIFSVLRQFYFSAKEDASSKRQSIDLAIFLNGLPIFTAELKNNFKGQNVEDAIEEYRNRNQKEAIFAYGRCLVHFAVDNELVYMTTHLQGKTTRFLPFNCGYNNGAGNPPNWQSFATSYLWECIWSQEVLLDLLHHFIQDVEEVNEKGSKTGKRLLIFPRYHQLETVRRLIADARRHATGQRYLVEHSAGSGKSNTIAWTAHQLSTLHDEQDQPIVDSVIVITDRRILDRQLQSTILQFEQTLGVVENIDKDAQQLKDALDKGKRIIVTTLQKFPVIVDQMSQMQDKRFAVLIDEAHSSQSGDSTGLMKKALTALNLEDAEKEDSVEQEDLEDRIVQEMQRRGNIPNASLFAFTATPKPKTLEIFGDRRDDGKFESFSLYSMRQAIEEGFILDVLQNYTTYRAYWNLLKSVEDDPNYERGRANVLLKAYVERHEATIDKKTAIMLEHFHNHVSHKIKGKAKAMIVTASRLHAVRYYQAVQRYLNAQGYPYKALVAFSGKVEDHGLVYTESGMNGVAESKTAETFKSDEYRILIVANKFQTGFDQPLLHTMYVDKKLGGVNAVQTLSRLNRTAPYKEDTMVLDFANEAEHIQQAFQPYYERTLLSHETDPNLLYDVQAELLGFHFYVEDEVRQFAELYWSAQGTQDKLYAVLRPVRERYIEADLQEQADFRKALNSYIRLYAFLVQILTFSDASLEMLYQFARHLLHYLPVEHHRLPIEIQQNIDLQSYRIQEISTATLTLARGTQEIAPMQSKERYLLAVDEMEPLSKIIEDLNTQFGTDFTEEDKVCLRAIEDRLAMREDLKNSLEVNTQDNAFLTFKEAINEVVQSMVDTNFKFYKHLDGDKAFAAQFLHVMFDRYTKRVAEEQQ
jgi:Type III restriction enzyme, res subunit./Type I restriction enzyme R protein N terminus (HSDR_N).